MKANAGHDAPTTRWTHRAGVLVLAWVLAAAWGSVVQTYWNLQALVDVGVNIPASDWWRVIGQDLIGFGPIYGGILAAGWLVALPVAIGLARRRPAARSTLLALAAGLGMVAAVRVVDAVAPMPVFFDATRSLPGLLGMALGALLAGWLYARWTIR